MNDIEVLDPIPDLDGELAALDAELGAIRMAERSSFGPELRAELSRHHETSGDWIRPSSPGRWAAVAATVAAILFAVAAPPAAVTSISVLMERLEAVIPAAGARGDGEKVAGPAPVSDAPLPTLSKVGVAQAIDPFKPVRMLRPRAIDQADVQTAIRRLYPQRLQRAGIGGIVNVQFHVDSTGKVIESLVFQSSGVPELDNAAMDAASLMRFQPATWDGRPFSTWVQFDIVFEPSVNALPAGISAADVGGEDFGAADRFGGPSLIMQETLELLQVALADSIAVARLGGIDGLAHGEPPRGSDPFAWRERAGPALENAMRRSPDNPAPFLALARIRRKQGLPDEARSLLEQGIQRAERAGITISPRLVAELEYELAGAARESWWAWDHLGRVPADAVPGGACSLVRTATANGEVTAETLIAWNFVCPDELRRLLGERFVGVDAPSDERALMVRSLEAAVAADPGNVRANVELLLDLAEHDDNAAFYTRARRFAFESRQHPYSRLLMGLAAEAMGRTDEAYTQLQAGLSELPPEEAARIRDIRPLLEPDAAQRMSSLAPAVRAQAEDEFWLSQDPLRSTPVNERLVAHLARSTYAYFQLGGSQTDAGSVWVRYGEPLRIRAVGEGTALRTELWDYGSGPAVTFRRPAASTALELTRETRAYLNDLRTTRPRAYGGSATAIEPLEAEVARFRDPAGALELDLTARVPEGLRASKEELTLALFQLDSRGREIRVEGHRVAGNGVVRLRVTAEPATREVVVEVVTASMKRAATAHVAVGGQLERAEAVRIDVPVPSQVTGPMGSDLQLVRVGSWPRRDVPRKPDLFDPLPDHAIAGPEFGLVFELYDLPSQRPYELKVFIQPVSGGPSRPAVFRPSGESQWGTLFMRKPAPSTARSTEYVSVRMPDVPAGAYTVRVVATLEDGSTIVLRRAIDRK